MIIFDFFDEILHSFLFKPQRLITGLDETLIWSVPFDNCAISTTTITEPQQELHHVIYVNPDTDSIHIMPQVKLTCKQSLFIESSESHQVASRT